MQHVKPSYRLLSGQAHEPVWVLHIRCLCNLCYTCAASAQPSLHVLQELNPDTAQKLIRASAGLGWSSLYPLLTRMADNTCCGDDMHMQAFLPHLLPALEALQLLLGELLTQHAVHCY